MTKDQILANVAILGVIKTELEEGNITNPFSLGDAIGATGNTEDEVRDALNFGISKGFVTTDGNNYNLDTSKDFEYEVQREMLLQRIETCEKAQTNFSYKECIVDAGFPTIGDYANDVKLISDIVHSVKVSECDYDALAPSLDRAKTFLELLKGRAEAEG